MSNEALCGMSTVLCRSGEHAEEEVDVIKLRLGRSEERENGIPVQPSEMESRCRERREVPGLIAVDKETFGTEITETSNVSHSADPENTRTRIERRRRGKIGLALLVGASRQWGQISISRPDGWLANSRLLST
jgi:hypothetical protein